MAATEVTMDDDLIFADLNRQISLLIDEEDDDDDYRVSRFALGFPQEFPGIVVHPPILPSQCELYQANCRREMSKGTGVFIPQSTQPRRKHRQGKRATASYAGKTKNKQLTNSRGRSNVATHATYNNAYRY